MTITLAIGTTASIASTYGTQKTVSAISNANPAVATLEASHGVIVGDIIHIKSGWELLNDIVVRISAVATNDVTLEGVNTTDTDKYPVGASAGTMREVTAWTEITQITRNFTVSGGEQNYADTSTLKNRQDQRVPVSRSPIDVVLPVYDDPAAAFNAIVTAADGVATAGRFVYPGGSRSLFAGYHTVGLVATVEDFTLRNAVTISFAGNPIRYTS